MFSSRSMRISTPFASVVARAASPTVEDHLQHQGCLCFGVAGGGFGGFLLHGRPLVHGAAGEVLVAVPPRVEGISHFESDVVDRITEIEAVGDARVVYGTDRVHTIRVEPRHPGIDGLK